MVNYTLVVFMLITFALLITVMVFAAMSGAEIKKSSCSKEDEADKAHKNTTIAAIIAGVSAVLVLIMIIIYIVVTRKEIAKDTAEQLKAAHEAVAAYAGQSIPPQITSDMFQSASSLPEGIQSLPNL